MFDNIINFFKNFNKQEKKDSKDTAKERLHLVLMQDRANVSADFLELMKQEIIEVIKKYIDVDENSIDVKLTNKVNADGTTGAPALYANIPIASIKEESKKIASDIKIEESKQEIKEEKTISEVKEERAIESEHKEENELQDEIIKEDKKETDNKDKKDDSAQNTKALEDKTKNIKTEEIKGEANQLNKQNHNNYYHSKKKNKKSRR